MCKRVRLGGVYAKGVGRQVPKRERDDRKQGSGVGLALGHLCPEHLQRHHDETATNTQKASEKAADQPDRAEDRARAYSAALGGVSGWLATTEWCRNWVFGAGAAAPFTFFFFFVSRPCLSRPLPMCISFYDLGQFAQ